VAVKLSNAPAGQDFPETVQDTQVEVVGGLGRDIPLPCNLELKFPVVLQKSDKIRDHKTTTEYGPVEPWGISKKFFIISVILYKHNYAKSGTEVATK
jgi:hypothetical protein